jgi:hypothetical protein
MKALTFLMACLASAPSLAFDPDPPWTYCLRGQEPASENAEKAWADMSLVLRIEPPAEASALPGMGTGPREIRRLSGALLTAAYEVPMTGSAVQSTSKFDGRQVWLITISGSSVQPHFPWALSENPYFHHTMVLEMPFDQAGTYPEWGISPDGWRAWLWNMRGPTGTPNDSDIGSLVYDDWTPTAVPYWRVPCNDPQHFLPDYEIPSSGN